MKEVKDYILSDAIKTSIKLNYKISRLKRVVALLTCIIIALIIGYFV